MVTRQQHARVPLERRRLPVSRPVDLTGGRRRAEAHHGHEPHAPGARGIDIPDPVRSLSLKAAARARPGISEFTWTPDGRALVFAYRGDLFRVGTDGAGLGRLTRGGDGASSPAYSPDGRYLSFLQDGELWVWHLGLEGSRPIQSTRAGPGDAAAAAATSRSPATSGRPIHDRSPCSTSIGARCAGCRSRCTWPVTSRR